MNGSLLLCIYNLTITKVILRFQIYTVYKLKCSIASYTKMLVAEKL